VKKGEREGRERGKGRGEKRGKGGEGKSIGGATIEALSLVPPQILGP